MIIPAKDLFTVIGHHYCDFTILTMAGEGDTVLGIPDGVGDQVRKGTGHVLLFAVQVDRLLPFGRETG